ncbi:hypothetical protein Cch01nite_30390 [Cellulomonas chitinilytica]|uniref:DUF1990 domain-containing protein n=1 Tax=Cellulomonas chitinilytica TaxID=398759 RepID=A0A919P419_9CELL|nr:YndJ family transporter [Cellulomonas chitinilytica]GIG22315.1 hypothetical protein Cch01nite_30390 [Cellulomonas chitinilytica]
MTAPLDPLALDVVRVVVALGAVVVLPAGLRLLGDDVVPRSSAAGWPVVGILAGVAVWLPVGPAAALLAVPFAAACGFLAGCAARLTVRGPWRRPWTACTVVSLATPAAGAAALVAERAGWGLLGFSGDYLALTVPHMLFAGFGACLVAGLLARAVPSLAGTVGAVAAPVGVLVVLLGYFVSDGVELVGAVLLTAGLWCAAGAASGLGRGRVHPRAARALTVAVVVSMTLALWWAMGEATGLPHPDLGWMVATHGILNAGAVVVCVLLALRIVGSAAGTRGGSDELTYTPVGGTRTGDRPPGFRSLQVRHLVLAGADERDRDRVGEALRTGRVHAAAGVDVRIEGGRTVPGARVETSIGAGPFRVTEPCRVVWATPDGFGYGTLPGHLFRGEEAFTVELDDVGLWFVVVAYSTPAVGWVRALGPLVVVGQRLYVRLLARGARRVAVRRAGDGARRVRAGAR